MKSFAYDKANQLVTSTVDDKVMNYAYDAAGRLIKEGSVASGFKTYSYGYLDKILEVQENGQQIAAFDYHIDGQIAKATHGDKTENFLWDGLALIHRGDNSFVNEPYVTGGNPILSSKDGVMFNDMLGTTLGIKNEKGFEAINMTAFGEPKTSQPNNSTTEIDNVGFFTGKPYIDEIGYAFLFRNYRADQGKWQTQDPIALLENLPEHDHQSNSLETRLGYPNGWNNLAYVNNKVFDCIDPLGLECPYCGAITPSLFNRDSFYAMGRDDMFLFNPDNMIMNFIENYMSGAHYFAIVHDSYVDQMTANGYPDLLVNIPSMPSAYVFGFTMGAINDFISLIDLGTSIFNITPIRPPCCIRE
ncbi:MAG: hypothetical protein PHS31_03080 [Victivallaceae bacterium]|nr:hypothetical protein [Victivallaceae bacterium]